MIGGKLAEMFVEIGGKPGPLDAELARTKSKLTQFASIAGGIASRIGLIGLGAGAVNWFRGAVLGAGDLNESLSKVEVTFGAATGKVLGFADNMAAKFGSARQEILDAASSFGLIFKGVGMADDASAKLSINLATMADDAASLFNGSLPEALEKIRAGLVGESEPLRAYGVQLNEVAVQQEAVRLGLAKNKNELTESAKIMARASLIEKGLAVAKGDHARTQDGLNNSLKEAGGRFANLGNAIGSWFTKPLTFATSVLNGFLQGLTWIADKIGWVAGALWRFNGSALQTVKVAEQLGGVGGGQPAAGPATTAAAAPVAAAKKAFDARAEVLKDEKEEAEKRLVDAEKEKRALETKEERRKQADYRTATALGFMPYSPSHYPTTGEIESHRQGANFDSERNKIEGFISAAKDKAMQGLVMAGALKNVGMGVLNNVAGAIEQKRPKLAGGVTDSESYAREVQDAALKNTGTAQEQLDEAKKHTSSLENIYKELAKGAKSVIGVFA